MHHQPAAAETGSRAGTRFVCEAVVCGIQEAAFLTIILIGCCEMRSIIPSVAALLFLGQLLSSPIFVRATAANLIGPCINISAKAEAHTSPALPRYSNLFAAAAENHVESVCLLLQKGADINARNKYAVFVDESNSWRM